MKQLSLGITEPITCAMQFQRKLPSGRHIDGGGSNIDQRYHRSRQRALSYMTFTVVAHDVARRSRLEAFTV